jgi:ComF family protein
VPGIIEHPAYHLLRWAWSGVDWVFPPICAGCKRPGFYLCDACLEAVRHISAPICNCCGQGIDQAGLCPACRNDPPAYIALRAWAWYDGPIRSAIHRLKYEGDMAMGEVLSRPLIQMLRAFRWPVNLVTAVPMGVARRAERGYNQAALLAWPVAYGCSLPYQSRALVKSRETRSQVGLNRQERRQNVEMAYQARHELVTGKNVLVIDDVATSGATLDACTKALLDAGANQVFGLTLARAMYATMDDHTQMEVQYDSASGNLQP